MQKLYQRSMFHLLRVNGQLAPALQAKVTVVEVIPIIPAVHPVSCPTARVVRGNRSEGYQLSGLVRLCEEAGSCPQHGHASPVS